MASDPEKHFWFEETYVFPHLDAADRADLSADHTAFRAALANGERLDQAAVDSHARRETDAIQRAARRGRRSS